MTGAVEKAHRSTLRRLGGTAVDDALFAQIIDLARTCDTTTAARDKASLHKELRAAMDAFRDVADRKPKAVSTSDELAAQRTKRRAGRTAS